MSFNKQLWTEAHFSIGLVHGCALGGFIGLELASKGLEGQNIVKLLILLPLISMTVITIDRIGHRAAVRKYANVSLYGMMAPGFVGIVYYLANDMGLSGLTLGIILISWLINTLFEVLINVRPSKVSAQNEKNDD